MLWNFVKSSNMAKIDENSSSTHFSANSVYLPGKKKSDSGYRFHPERLHQHYNNCFRKNSCILILIHLLYYVWQYSFGNSLKQNDFFSFARICAKCCFNICCEKNQINPSSCWFDVPPLRLHLSIISNFNINCADSGLSRTLWTVVFSLLKINILRKYFI